MSKISHAFPTINHVTKQRADLKGDKIWGFLLSNLQMAAKEATDYIQAHATQGDPESVIKTADTYSTTIKGNMNVGNKKGAAIDEIIKEHKPKVFLNIVLC